jgi:hypothetical protein
MVSVRSNFFRTFRNDIRKSVWFESSRNGAGMCGILRPMVDVEKPVRGRCSAIYGRQEMICDVPKLAN